MFSELTWNMLMSLSTSGKVAIDLIELIEFIYFIIIILLIYYSHFFSKQIMDYQQSSPSPDMITGPGNCSH